MSSMTPEQLKRVSQMRQLAASGGARAIRQQRRITLRELADVLGASPSTVSRWEQGRCTPRTPAALRWADALDVEVPA